MYIPKDKRCISIIAKAGAMNAATFNRVNISNNRILSFQKAGLIQSVWVPDKYGNGGNTYYKLTEKGKDFCRKECNIKNFISNGPNSTIHNAKVAEEISHLSKAEQDSCLSERQLQPFIESRLEEYLEKQQYDHYEELMDALKSNQLSMPDVIFKADDGSYEAIEVITDNYNAQAIESKLMTGNLLSVKVTIVHT